MSTREAAATAENLVSLNICSIILPLSSIQNIVGHFNLSSFCRLNLFFCVLFKIAVYGKRMRIAFVDQNTLSYLKKLQHRKFLLLSPF